MRRAHMVIGMDVKTSSVPVGWRCFTWIFEKHRDGRSIRSKRGRILRQNEDGGRDVDAVAFVGQK